VEYRFAVDKRLSGAAVRNRKGQFVRAVPESISAAIPQKLSEDPTELAMSILRAEAKKAYPISYLSWLLIPKIPKGRSKLAIHKFLDMILRAGQVKAQECGYVPLPSTLVERQRAMIREALFGDH
jgi:phosphate transport system substrate-binding protein